VDYLIVALIGFVGGGIVVYVALLQKQKRLDEQRRYQADQTERIEDGFRAISARELTLKESATSLKAQNDAAQLNLHRRIAVLVTEEARFNARLVSYQELQHENAVVKADLFNLTVQARKFGLDHQVLAKAQQDLDERSNLLAARYLKDNVKWIGSSLNPNNYVTCKQRLQDVIERCRSIGFNISPSEEAALFSDLKSEFSMVVRAALEREEQARIRAQIREEQMREREIQRELQRLEREREAIKVALDRALAEAEGRHSEEIDRLMARNSELEASQRKISQAQLTRTGHVYVISNIGSFGENVFKIGMTRRENPSDRVCELGDASVPFPFDVHMMIKSDDAPTLENALHRKLHKLRVNRANPRKEFFRIEIASLLEIVKEHHGEVEHFADAKALEYRQSLSMSDEDQEFIEQVYDELDDDGLAPDEDAPANECASASTETLGG